MVAIATTGTPLSTAQASLSEGMEVEITVVDGKVIITPEAKEKSAMQSITLRCNVGEDGILQLQVQSHL